MWITCLIVLKIFVIFRRRWTNCFRDSWGYDPRNPVCLDNLLEMNEEKYQNFRDHRIDICNAAITATIKNKFTEPADDKVLNMQNTRKKESFLRLLI